MVKLMKNIVLHFSRLKIEETIFIKHKQQNQIKQKNIKCL